MRVTLTTLLDLIGLALILIGSFLIDWRFAMIVLGVLVLAGSYVMARLEERSP